MLRAPDPQGLLKQTLKRLEALAPDSPSLAVFEQAAADDAIEHVPCIHPQAHGCDLERKGARSAPRTVGARANRGTSPDNPEYRREYAFALLAMDDRTVAREQAEILESRESRSHAFHFNLGQIFWFTGDWKRGHAHLELALAYAQDDERKKDVYEEIAYFKQRQFSSEA